MYDIQKYQRDISVKEYIREYVNVAEFIEYCKECPNYNAVWSCPPYDFEPEDFWNQFSELHIIARKIIFEEGTGPKEGKRIMEEVKAGMSEELYDMEKFFPGSVSLSAGAQHVQRRRLQQTSGRALQAPGDMRYSIESIGGNVGLTVSKLMGIELEWVQEGKLPSYFVLDWRASQEMKDRLKEHICTLLQEKGGRAVIAIDGMAASGKSTLAARLAEELDGCVIHMDDFFLPPELRTQERLSSPGGNVHYERFEAEVAEALRSGRDFEYGVFDCSRMEITASRRIKAGGLVIVEGAYAPQT